MNNYFKAVYGSILGILFFSQATYAVQVGQKLLMVHPDSLNPTKIWVKVSAVYDSHVKVVGSDENKRLIEWIVPIAALEEIASSRPISPKCQQFLYGLDQFLEEFEFQIIDKKMAALDHVLDELFFSVTVPESTKIGFDSKEKGGFGDLLFAFKSAVAIQNQIPEAHLEIITKKEETAIKLRKFKGDSRINVVIADQQRPRPAYQFLISGPALAKRNQFLNYYSTKNIGLLEYGYTVGPPGYYTTGVTAKALGIFFDQELDRYSTNPEMVSAENRLSYLHRLESQGLKELLLGLSDEVDYGKNHKIYFAYGHKNSSIFRFIELAASISQDNKNLDIVLPSLEAFSAAFDGIPTSDFPPVVVQRFGIQRFLSMKDLLIHEKDKLVQNGISQVEILIPMQNSPELFESKVISLSDQPGKTVRLIYKTFLSNQDIKTLIQSSEPLVLVTGDQSFTEAVSAGKLFSYEIYLHKSEFFNSILKLAREKYDPKLADLLRYLSIQQDDYKTPLAKEAVDGIHHEVLMVKFQKMIRDLKISHNLGDRLPKKVKKEIYLKNHPEMGEKLQLLQNAISRKARQNHLTDILHHLPEFERVCEQSDEILNRLHLHHGI